MVMKEYRFILISCLLIAFTFTHYLIISNENFELFSKTTNNEMSHLTLAFSSVTTTAHCNLLNSAGDKIPLMIFGREFYSIPSNLNRTEELIEAISTTVTSNPCSLFVFVVTKMEWSDPLIQLHKRLGFAIRIYYTPGFMTLDLLYSAVRNSSTTPSDIFVTSTGDVAINKIDHLVHDCGNALLNEGKLLIISRKDSPEKSCEETMKIGSADVFIGSISKMITTETLDQLVYSPSYWGAENVAVKVLAGDASNVFNLCPFIDVHHVHASRHDQSARIRINGGGNTVNHLSNSAANVCTGLSREESSSTPEASEAIYFEQSYDYQYN